MRILFFILIFLPGVYNVFAQTPYSIQLNQSNGLPSTSVYNIFQDSKGFIWISGNTGLIRYDGFEFKTYKSEFQTSEAGSSIREDIKGRIWYENFDGYFYYVESDSLKPFQQNKPIAYIPAGITNKYVFAFQRKGLDVFSIDDLSWIKTIELSEINVSDACSDSESFYYIIDKNIFKIDADLNMTSTSFMDKFTDGPSHINCSGNNIYITNRFNDGKKVFLFDKQLKKQKDLYIKSPLLIHGVNITDQKIWILTSDGSYVYEDEKLQGHFFGEKNISCVIKDRQNNYWISTINDGIYITPDLNTFVYPIDHGPSKMVKIKNNYLIAKKSGQFLMSDNSFKEIISIKKEPNGADIYYMYYDNEKNALFYSSDKFSVVRNLDFKNPEFYNTSIKELVKISDNYFALSASGFCGILRYKDENSDPVLDSFYFKNKNPNLKNMAFLFDGVRAKSVTFNSEKKWVYFATNLGLIKWDYKNSSEIKNENQSFYASKIIAHKNDLYALNAKGNLYSIVNEKEFVLMNSSLGISNNDVRLVKKQDGKLVVVSRYFVHLIDLNTNSISKFIHNSNVYLINDLILEEDHLLLLADNSIVAIPVKSSSLKSKNSAVLILNEFIADGIKLNPNQFNNLQFGQNDITISFSILDFGNLKSEQAYYRVNNEGWKPLSGDTRTLQFASLKPGLYDVFFKINNKITRTTFEIDAPFWQKSWFIIPGILLFLVFAYLYYKSQLNKLKNKNKLLNEKMELEKVLNKSVLTSIKSQMNPHFFYNALNTIQAYIFTNERTMANSYLSKFSKLTRSILEQSEKELISLSDEIESLTLYLELEKMRFRDGFEYTIEYGNLLNEGIELPPMVVQPYVENAVKHGFLHKESSGNLKVKFERKGSSLIIIIDDDGIGRKRSEELNKIKNEKYSSFSSQANKKRLEILNRGSVNKLAIEMIDKTDQNGFAAGTKVIISIPIN